MSQATLTGGVVDAKTPESTLSNNERRILHCLRSAGRGLTHDQIRERMKLSGISCFDNRLRELRSKGYAESHFNDALQQLLWYPIEKKEAQL